MEMSTSGASTRAASSGVPTRQCVLTLGSGFRVAQVSQRERRQPRVQPAAGDWAGRGEQPRDDGDAVEDAGGERGHHPLRQRPVAATWVRNPSPGACVS